MMQYIIEELNRNKTVIADLLIDCDEALQTWRPKPDKWSLLEIICHLIDEEQFDFRFRTQWVLEKPNETPPPIDPVKWIQEHQYMKQDFSVMTRKFVEEREASILWLSNLENPKWDNLFVHSKLGEVSAGYFLRNWLVHDYLHIRQICKTKFDYLNVSSKHDLGYAGAW